MRCGRVIFISAVLALGAAGSALAGTAIAGAATHAPTVVHVQAGPPMNPEVFYNG